MRSLCLNATDLFPTGCKNSDKRIILFPSLRTNTTSYANRLNRLGELRQQRRALIIHTVIKNSKTTGNLKSSHSRYYNIINITYRSVHQVFDETLAGTMKICVIPHSCCITTWHDYKGLSVSGCFIVGYVFIQWKHSDNQDVIKYWQVISRKMKLHILI